jgi:Spy/CpxP family protein refolding chaperone
LALVSAISLLSAQAQTSYTSPSPATIAQHRVSYLTTVLSLTPAQQQQATTIFTTAATAASGIRPQMKTARQSLATAVQNNDSASIASLSTTIGGLVGQLVSAKATANAAFYQILTPSQQSTLTQLQSLRHGRGFTGMRGGSKLQLLSSSFSPHQPCR